jgi:hypothetical protein
LQTFLKNLIPKEKLVTNKAKPHQGGFDFIFNKNGVHVITGLTEREYREWRVAYYSNSLRRFFSNLVPHVTSIPCPGADIWQ